MLLLVLDSKSYYNKIIELLDFLCNEKNQSIVYLAITKPYASLSAMISQNSISAKNILFIDAISSTVLSSNNSDENCIFLSNPQNLTDMSLAISEAEKMIKNDQKSILLDSLSTLLVYNEIESVVRFVHFLSTKMRIQNVNGIFVYVRDKFENIIMSELSQYCDKVIELK